jgi:hypothetical protein
MARTRRSGIPAAQWFYAQAFHTFITQPATPAVVELHLDNDAADALTLAEREDLVDAGDGSACSVHCGFCGRCS